MSGKRHRYSSEFKAKVALEALKGLKTMSELTSFYGVHSTQIGQWKRLLKNKTSEIFSNGRIKSEEADEVLKARLYEEIGRLKVELDWLKKNIHTIN